LRCGGVPGVCSGAAAGARLTLSGELFRGVGNRSVGEKSKYHPKAATAKISRSTFLISPKKGSSKCANKITRQLHLALIHGGRQLIASPSRDRQSDARAARTSDFRRRL